MVTLGQREFGDAFIREVIIKVFDLYMFGIFHCAMLLA